MEISAEAKLTRGFREGLHQEEGLYCIHRVDSIEHVGFDVKIFTGRHKGVINKASSEIRGGAQYNVALFTSALTKANSGQQSRLFIETLRSTEDSGDRFVSFDRKLRFGAFGREKSLIQNVRESCIQESFGGN